MVTLKQASKELFRRTPDETFQSFDGLLAHCRQQREDSHDVWQMPQALDPHLAAETVSVKVNGYADVRLNDWSFSQFCKLAHVSKETLNRLSPETASRVLTETLPASEKPMQLLTSGETIRSMHGVAYTRLWNADLLDVVAEYTSDFQAPQKAAGGGTGLYCGEQDLFAFLIDPSGWAEIDGEAFAPGFFIWNSEVGRRSLGIQTFWFQAVCANHIVWDATEVVEFTRKHTANVFQGLEEIRRIIESLVAKRDARRDSFVKVMRQAMSTRLGETSEEIEKILTNGKIPKALIAEALDLAQATGKFTIFSLVNSLTRSSQTVRYAGDRTELDSRIGALLQLAV